MSDYILRKDAIEIVQQEADRIYNECAVIISADDACELISRIPSAHVRENKRGTWEFEFENLDGEIEYSCSNCGWVGANGINMNFCPCCGADMRGDINEIELQFIQKWIPCSKELPEQGVNVLVTWIGGVDIAYWGICEDGRYWDFGMFSLNESDGEFEDITAWMPLPEAYKGEVNNGK